MKTIILSVVALIIFWTGSVSACDSSGASSVWYSSILKKYFPSKLKINLNEYSIKDIPCLPTDITKFNVVAEKVNLYGPAFQVKGSIKLKAVPLPFWVIDGAMGEKYMLHLQAFLFSSSGNIIWQQNGFPKGGWVNGRGDVVDFILIDAFEGSINKAVLLIIAAGDPILSDNSDTRVLLGMKKLTF